MGPLANRLSMTRPAVLQSSVLDAVERAQQDYGAPVRTGQIWTKRKKAWTRVLHAITELPPDMLGRRLVGIARPKGCAREWVVLRG